MKTFITSATKIAQHLTDCASYKVCRTSWDGSVTMAFTYSNGVTVRATCTAETFVTTVAI